MYLDIYGICMYIVCVNIYIYIYIYTLMARSTQFVGKKVKVPCSY